jgi:hypothetical protein
MQLMLTDYDIKDAKMTLIPGSIDIATGETKGNYLLWTDGKKQIEGKQAFHSDGHLNIEIRPDKNADGTGPKSFCVMRFEVPKFAGGHNYHPVDFRGTQDAMIQAEKQLKEVGIKTNIQTAKPCRIDAFDNVEGEEPYSCYEPVLALLQGSRMKRRGYENGFLWENTRQEICAYDKRQHLQHKKESVGSLPKHPLRFEFRALKSAKIRETYGFHSVADMLEGFDSIKAVYRNVMKQNLFKYSVDDVEAMCHNELVAGFRKYQADFGARWLDAYFRDYGVFCMMQKSSRDTVLGALAEVEENKMKRSRLRKKLDTAHFASSALQLVPASKRSHGQLYNELREKLLAA